MIWIRTASGALAIFGAAMVLAMGHALFSDPILLAKRDAAPVVRGNEDPGATDPADTPQGTSGESSAAIDPIDAAAVELEGNKITLERAYALFVEGVSFIDARKASDFEAGRIEYAFHLPASRVSAGDGYGVMERLPFEGPIVIYCTGGDCSDSTNVEILLTHAGYSGFLIMNAGYDDWVAAGYPTEAGPIDESTP